jgi:hypothetical protein
MTNTAAAVTVGIADATQNTREIDGVLDTAVQEIRTDSANVAPDASTPAPSPCSTYLFPNTVAAYTSGGAAKFDVTCQQPTPSGSCPDPSSCRDEIISVYPAGAAHTTADLLGQTRIVIHDKIASGEPLPGYTLDVCDWQIGDALDSTTNSC